MEQQDILSMTLPELQAAVQELGEPKFRAKQIFNWLHQKRVTDFSEMTTLSLPFRERLASDFCINRLKIAKRLASSVDDTVKYLYELPDGNYVETVCMQYHHGTSLCISTQVGCRMGCRFCASAIAGFVRNLTPAEMLLQIYETERAQNCKISSLVLMGIGEPLDNYDNVILFMHNVNNENGLNISMRNITLSTCGVVPRIYDLMNENLQITLTISLHAPNDTIRSKTMPVNDKWGIDELLKACRDYIKKTNRRVSFEYTLINKVIDTPECANELCSRLHGMLCHVNLIPVNDVEERGNVRSSDDSVNKFLQILQNNGINATIRRTLGSDINASCGQLRRKSQG